MGQMLHLVPRRQLPVHPQERTSHRFLGWFDALSIGEHRLASLLSFIVRDSHSLLLAGLPALRKCFPLLPLERTSTATVSSFRSLHDNEVTYSKIRCRDERCPNFQAGDEGRAT
jgi:hypothetical protein